MSDRLALRLADLRTVAARWTDPEHDRRAEAEAETLDAENTFTEEGLAFAVNQAMEVLAEDAFAAWIGETDAAEPVRLALFTTGNSPLEGLFEATAAWLLGHEVTMTPPAASPALLPAFFGELAAVHGEPVVRFAPRPRLLDDAEAVLGTGSEADRRSWAQLADRHGIRARYVVPDRLGVAVLDGREDAAARSGLAEDLLLHDGATPQNVRLVFAPDDLDPDAVLDTMAALREEIPAHSGTDGRLAMPTAFLASAKQPHATGPGFLVSKGDAEPQSGAHIRWVGYAALSEVVAWLDGRDAFVAATPAVAEALRDAGLPDATPVLGFGDAHRPEPGHAPMTAALLDFLRDPR